MISCEETPLDVALTGRVRRAMISNSGVGRCMVVRVWEAEVGSTHTHTYTWGGFASGAYVAFTSRWMTNQGDSSTSDAYLSQLW